MMEWKMDERLKRVTSSLSPGPTIVNNTSTTFYYNFNKIYYYKTVVSTPLERLWGKFRIMLHDGVRKSPASCEHRGSTRKKSQ